MERMTMDFEKFGGRKFLLGLLTILILALLATFKSEAITTELVAALLGVLGLFNTANTVASVKAMNNATETTKSVSQIDTSSIESEQAQLKAQLNQLADVVLRLTTPQQPASMEPSQQPKERTNTNAQANREAIAAYLSQNFGG